MTARCALLAGTTAAAVSMARFVVGHAVADWAPKGGVRVDIEVADSPIRSYHERMWCS